VEVFIETALQVFVQAVEQTNAIIPELAVVILYDSQYTLKVHVKYTTMQIAHLS